MRHAAVASLLLVLAACEGEPTYTDGLPRRPPGGEWIEVAPGGDTICSRGTDYRFYVRGGDPRRVIVDFQGGGACWNASTCSAADALFNDRVGGLGAFLGFLGSGVLGGIFDPNGDFADWTIVHVPYCTGDIHWGNARVEYGPGVTIEHRGYVNASAALAWVYSRYPDPERVFVSGCSAGAYGAALHSAYIADHYPSASVAVLADGGAGIVTDDFLTESLPNWNAQPGLPPFIEALQRPLDELSLPDLYIGIGRHFPSLRMAQTGTNWDKDQIFYFVAMGGSAAEWSSRYRTSLARIEAAVPNFRAYVPPGSVHCATPYPYFQEREVNGVRLADWTRRLAEEDAAPPTVACEGEGCCSDPVCDACLAGDTRAHCGFCDTWIPGYATECP
ncbi:MAG: pectinesterase [Sandaracinaceae bacterium]|nr:pectinesterase [Sandaracinaceae bacterium]